MGIKKEHTVKETKEGLIRWLEQRPILSKRENVSENIDEILYSNK